MSFSFKKCISFGKIRINIGKRGIGVSAGVKGARVGLSTNGLYSCISIPGTGIYKRTYHKNRSDKSKHSFGSLLYISVFLLLIVLALKSFGLFVFILSLCFLLYLITQLDSEKIANKRIGKSFKLQIEGKNDQSRIYLSKVIEKYPEHYVANILMGLSYFHEGFYNESLIFLNNIKNYNKEQGKIVNIIISRVYMNLGDYLTPIQLLQDIENNDHDLEIIYLLGLCFFETCHYNLAVNALREAPLLKREMSPILLEIHYLLGKSYRELGDKIRSNRHLDRVFAKDINYSGNPFIIKRFFDYEW